MCMHLLGAGPRNLFVFFYPTNAEKKNKEEKNPKEQQILSKETIFKYLSRLAVNAPVPYSYNAQGKKENKALLQELHFLTGSLLLTSSLWQS